VDAHAPGAVQRHAQGLGQRVGAHAGGPHQGAVGEGAAVGEVHVGGARLADDRARAQVDAATAQDPLGVGAGRRVVGGQDVGRRLEQDDPRPREVELRVVGRQDAVEQLDERAGHLDAGGSGADDHDVERAVGDRRGVAGRLLEAPQQVAAQRQGLRALFRTKACSLTPGMPKSW
jgi:hypothetical protein